MLGGVLPACIYGERVILFVRSYFGFCDRESELFDGGDMGVMGIHAFPALLAVCAYAIGIIDPGILMMATQIKKCEVNLVSRLKKCIYSPFDLGARLKREKLTG